MSDHSRIAAYTLCFQKLYRIIGLYLPLIVSIYLRSNFSGGLRKFLPRDATHSAVMRLHVVCPSVCDVQVSRSHRLEYFENNFTAEQLEDCALSDPNMGDLVQREHPKNQGGIPVGSLQEHKNVQSFLHGARQDQGYLLLRTNRKSHTHFRLAPKSMTLKGRNVTLAEINKIPGGRHKNFNEDRLILSAVKCKRNSILLQTA